MNILSETTMLAWSFKFKKYWVGKCPKCQLHKLLGVWLETRRVVRLVMVPDSYFILLVELLSGVDTDIKNPRCSKIQRVQVTILGTVWYYDQCHCFQCSGFLMRSGTGRVHQWDLVQGCVHNEIWYRVVFTNEIWYRVVFTMTSGTGSCSPMRSGTG